MIQYFDQTKQLYNMHTRYYVTNLSYFDEESSNEEKIILDYLININLTVYFFIIWLILQGIKYDKNNS